MVTFLADFLLGVSIVHTKGKDHFVPNALSCIPVHLSALMTSKTCLTWLPDIYITQEHDSSMKGYWQLTQ